MGNVSQDDAVVFLDPKPPANSSNPGDVRGGNGRSPVRNMDELPAAASDFAGGDLRPYQATAAKRQDHPGPGIPAGQPPYEETDGRSDDAVLFPDPIDLTPAHSPNPGGVRAGNSRGDGGAPAPPAYGANQDNDVPDVVEVVDCNGTEDCKCSNPSTCVPFGKMRCMCKNGCSHS